MTDVEERKNWLEGYKKELQEMVSHLKKQNVQKPYVYTISSYVWIKLKEDKLDQDFCKMLYECEIEILKICFEVKERIIKEFRIEADGKLVLI